LKLSKATNNINEITEEIKRFPNVPLDIINTVGLSYVIETDWTVDGKVKLIRKKYPVI